MRELFRKFANHTSTAVGSPWAFILAVAIILIWGLTGPLYHYSDTWQLIINTGTTIVTFLMVFLIQNTQNRDAVAIHLKLDELLRAVEGARTGLVDLESLSDEELQRLQEAFQRLRKQENEQIDEICEEVAEEKTERVVAKSTGDPPSRPRPVGANGKQTAGS
jgi:low affinity Fe/Cu permease